MTDHNDPELTAMAALSSTLGALDPPTRARVLTWAASRFDVQLPQARALNGGGGRSTGEPSKYGDVVELFEAASPTTNGDKVLVVAYWFQQIEGERDIDAQRVNTQLKQLGHGIPNITSAFAELIAATPKLALQVRKGGTTKQARKRYRITTEGVKRVSELLHVTPQ